MSLVLLEIFSLSLNRLRFFFLCSVDLYYLLVSFVSYLFILSHNLYRLLSQSPDLLRLFLSFPLSLILFCNSLYPLFLLFYILCSLILRSSSSHSLDLSRLLSLLLPILKGLDFFLWLNIKILVI